MRRRNQLRIDPIGEDIRGPQLRHIVIQAFDIGYATAKHDHFRIDYVDYRGQALGQSHFVTFQRSFRERIALFGEPDDLRCLELFTATEPVVPA